MKKKLSKLVTGIFAFAAAAGLFVSCENFLEGKNLKGNIDSAVTYENTVSVAVNVAKLNPDDTNEIEPSGKLSGYKVGYPFEINYTSSSSFIFKKWQAVDAENNILESSVVEFKNAEKENTQVTVKTSAPVTIQAVSAAVPKIVARAPEYDSNGVSPTAELTVQFNTSMKDANFDFSNIKITDLNGQDLRRYFNLPVATSDSYNIYKIQVKTVDLINSDIMKRDGIFDCIIQFTSDIENDGIKLVKNDFCIWKLRFNDELESVPPETRSLDVFDKISGGKLVQKNIDSFIGTSEKPGDYGTNFSNGINIKAVGYDKNSGVEKFVIKETRIKDSNCVDVAVDPSLIKVTEIYSNEFTDGPSATKVVDIEYDLKTSGNGVVNIETYFVDFCGNKGDSNEFSVIKYTDFKESDLKWGNGPSKIVDGKLLYGVYYMDKLKAANNFNITRRDDDHVILDTTGHANLAATYIIPEEDYRIALSYHKLYETYISNYEDFEAVDINNDISNKLSNFYVQHIYFKKGDMFFYNTAGDFTVNVEYGISDNFLVELKQYELDSTVYYGVLLDKDKNPLENIEALDINIKVENSYSKITKKLTAPSKNYYTKAENRSFQGLPATCYARVYFTNHGEWDKHYYFFTFDENYTVTPGSIDETSKNITIPAQQTYNGTVRFAGITADGSYHDAYPTWNYERNANDLRSSQPRIIPTFHSENIQYYSIAVNDGLLSNVSAPTNFTNMFETTNNCARYKSDYHNSNIKDYIWAPCYGDLQQSEDVLTFDKSNDNNFNIINFGSYIDPERTSIGPGDVNSNKLRITVGLKDNFWTDTGYDNFKFILYYNVHKQTSIDGTYKQVWETCADTTVIRGKNSFTMDISRNYGAASSPKVGDGSSIYFENTSTSGVKKLYMYYKIEACIGAKVKCVTGDLGKQGSPDFAYGYSAPTSSMKNPTHQQEKFCFGEVKVADLDCIYPMGKDWKRSYDSENFTINFWTVYDDNNLRQIRIKDKNDNIIYEVNDINSPSYAVSMPYYPLPGQTSFEYLLYAYDVKGNGCKFTADANTSINIPASLWTLKNRKASSTACTFADYEENLNSLTVISDQPVYCEILASPHSYEIMKDATVAQFQFYKRVSSAQTLQLSTARQVGFYKYDLSQVESGNTYIIVMYFSDGTILHTPVAVKE